MTFIEGSLFSLNLLLIVAVLFRLLRHANPMLFWSPLMFVTVTWTYYSVIGPVVALLSGEMIDRGQDMHVFLADAWLGGTIFFACLLLGYRYARAFSIQVPLRSSRSSLWLSRAVAEQNGRIGIWLMVGGCVLYGVGVGTGFFAMLNPFALSEESLGSGAYGGAFANYFAFAVQMFIPACVLLLLAARRNSRYSIPFGICLFVTMAIYLSISFRYRILMLLCSLLTTHYLDRWRRPTFLTLGLAGILAVGFMGFIGATRDYGLGLRLNRVSEEGLLQSTIRNGMGDSGIFFTSGGVINAVPDRIDYATFAPITGALLLPIPSAFLKNKYTNQYLDDIIGVIYGRESASGAAYMFFAEWYYAFSWPGLVIASLLFGYLLGRLWIWFLHRSNDTLAMAVYVTVMPLSYVALSRGYFAQFVMVAGFSALPIYLVYRWNARRSGQKAIVPVFLHPPRQAGKLGQRPGLRHP